MLLWIVQFKCCNIQKVFEMLQACPIAKHLTKSAESLLHIVTMLCNS